MFIAQKPATASARMSREYSGSARIGLDYEGMRVVADGSQSADQVRRPAFGRAPFYGGAFHGQVYAGEFDTGQRRQGPLDRCHAGRAMDAWDREIGLTDAVAEIATCKKQLVSRIRSGSVPAYQQGSFGAGCAAAHVAAACRLGRGADDII